MLRRERRVCRDVVAERLGRRLRNHLCTSLSHSPIRFLGAGYRCPARLYDDRMRQLHGYPVRGRNAPSFDDELRRLFLARMVKIAHNFLSRARGHQTSSSRALEETVALSSSERPSRSANQRQFPSQGQATSTTPIECNSLLTFHAPLELSLR